MKFCEDCVGEEGACCDFCSNYNFNADPEGRYTGNGYCTQRECQKDPGDVCDDFRCEHVTAPAKG